MQTLQVNRMERSLGQDPIGSALCTVHVDRVLSGLLRGYLGERIMQADLSN